MTQATATTPSGGVPATPQQTSTRPVTRFPRTPLLAGNDAGRELDVEQSRRTRCSSSEHRRAQSFDLPHRYA